MYALNAPVPLRGSGAEASEKRVAVEGILGHKSTVEVLLLHKADVNARTTDMLSPLIVAAGHERPPAVRELIGHKAEVNAVTSRGQTALLMAAALGSMDVTRYP